MVIKGQHISKEFFLAFNSSKKQFFLITVLASKKGSKK